MHVVFQSPVICAKLCLSATHNAISVSATAVTSPCYATLLQFPVRGAIAVCAVAVPAPVMDRGVSVCMVAVTSLWCYFCVHRCSRQMEKFVECGTAAVVRPWCYCCVHCCSFQPQCYWHVFDCSSYLCCTVCYCSHQLWAQNDLRSRRALKP